jgi:hypothetical protein
MIYKEEHTFRCFQTRSRAGVLSAATPIVAGTLVRLETAHLVGYLWTPLPSVDH